MSFPQPPLNPASAGSPSAGPKPAKIRVLFVDDQVAILDMFSMVLSPMQDQWDVSYASTGDEAMALVEKQQFEVVISDMRMPGMNGARLLSRVMSLHPGTARLILSGYADHEEVAQSLGAAHQFLKKPCDLLTLKSTIARVCGLDVFLRNDTLKQLASRMTVLPSVPTVYFRMLKELESSSASPQSIGKIVAQDAAITTKLLQLVNSAFFGIARKVVDPTDAVQLLGVNTVRSLALMLQTFSCFDQAKLPGFSINSMWEHSMAVGQLAKQVARWAGAPASVVDESFIAGLLHDLGKLMLAANMSSQYAEVLAAAKTEPDPLFTIERRAFGADHADLGGYLIGLWGLPVAMVEAVALHHSPSRGVSRTFSPLTAVHVANVLVSERVAGTDLPVRSALDMGYLAEVGIDGDLDQWRSRYAESEAEKSAAA